MSRLSPLISLATQMHSQPGVFAVLLGSGVSTGAGLPTGWQVVKRLVEQAATANDPTATSPISDAEVEQWWEEYGSGELGYSSVLEMLAPTPAGRQALLERFLQPETEGEGDVARGPSEAHRALARMVRGGAVRVIMTTNFDRLMEHALAEEGIEPQVIARPEAVAGMKPLAHASATIIKLHGDYKDLTTLNTAEELGAYPDQWQTLIRQVLDEYGLLISGWSTESDTALVHAIESCPARRYPMYWDSRSSNKPAAQHLLTFRSGIVIPSSGADELFTELDSSLQALDRLSEPPVSTAIAVARLKRYLHDQRRRIDLHDLVMARLDPIRAAIAAHGSAPVSNGESGIQKYEQILEDYREACLPLLELLVTGVRHDDGTHRKLWGEVLDRLLAARRPPAGTWNETLWNAQHYPATLSFYTMGAASITAGHEELFIALGREHSWTYPFNQRPPEPACHALRPDSVLSWDNVNALKRWDGGQWQQPPSHLVRADLTDVLDDLPPDGDVSALLDDVEYRHALLAATTTTDYPHPLTGEYRGDRIFGDNLVKQIGLRFRTSADQDGANWPWWAILDADDLDASLVRLVEEPASRRQ